MTTTEWKKIIKNIFVIHININLYKNNCMYIIIHNHYNIIDKYNINISNKFFINIKIINKILL